MINSTGEVDGLLGSVQLMSNSSQAVAERETEKEGWGYILLEPSDVDLEQSNQASCSRGSGSRNLPVSHQLLQNLTFGTNKKTSRRVSRPLTEKGTN